MLADEFFDLLADACPPFAPIWAEEVAWAKQDDEEPTYLLMTSEITPLLGVLQRSGETACFPAVFTAIDRALTEGDDLTRMIADALVYDLCSGSGTRRDPSYFEPYLGPVAAEEWRAIQRRFRDPDPRWLDILSLLVARNPSRLTGNLILEYRVASYHLPGILDLAESFERFRRALWHYVHMHLPKDLDVPEDRYDDIARILWNQWTDNTKSAQSLH